MDAHGMATSPSILCWDKIISIEFVYQGFPLTHSICWHFCGTANDTTISETVNSADFCL